MASFADMVLKNQNPTPYGFFDEDADFQQEAEQFVTFTKRKLGDDVLSVELTRKMKICS